MNKPGRSQADWPAGEWPPFAKPYSGSPPEGAVGIALPIRDGRRFFKMTFNSLAYFTNYRYMLTVVDNMSGADTVKYLRSLRSNHYINILQHQKDNSLGAMWNLALKFMFSYTSVKYGVVLTPTVIVEPFWLSTLVRALDGKAAAVALPQTNHLVTCDVALFHRSLWEDLGGFDETTPNPLRYFLARASARDVEMVTANTYIHKFKMNSFDSTRSPETASPENKNQEATHAGT